jgi:hypothetical protein
MLGPHTKQVSLAVTCVFEWCSVQIVARTAAVLNEVIRSLRQSLQANVGDITSSHDPYIPNISKFINHPIIRRCTLCDNKSVVI